MTQYIFFSGKGGVGKTTLAATTAIYYSKKGKRTLLVSTDPAGNLGDIFECEVSTEPIKILQNLFIAQMDADAITDAYKNRILEPLSVIFDELSLARIKEEFNSACTVEIATFDKFTDFLSDETYDFIVFDTAPTGHTLRLMTLPNEWDKFIKKSTKGSGQTCIGPVFQIEASRAKYANAVQVLQDSCRTKVYLVSRPEKTSVYETLRARTELEKNGIHNFQLIINGVYNSHSTTSDIFRKLAKNQKVYINELKSKFPDNTFEVPMQQSEIKGVINLALLGEIIFEKKNTTIQTKFECNCFNKFSSASNLLNLLEKKKHNRIIILTGKGGVGKTVIACTIALKLAEKGKTLLFTTDPAAHIGQVLETSINHIPANVAGDLWAVNIDQKKAVEEYRKKILNDAKINGYTSELITLLAEELDSPCTEEIAIFEQFANLLNNPNWDYFVLDTAPTGHTLRLLELPFEYKKQLDLKAIGKKHVSTNKANNKIESLINRLKNPDETSFLLVAYPEFTPLYEGYRAMKDLERVGINTQGIFLNNILSEHDCTDNFSKERWKLQQYYLHQASKIYYQKPIYAIPLQSSEIIGIEQLKVLSELIFKQ